MPSCTYTPNPSYTDDARQAKVSGSLLLEGVVDTDEKLKAVRVQRGMCCGLNQKSIQTLSTWKCKPGSYDGKPEPVLVMFEVNFRLY